MRFEIRYPSHRSEASAEGNAVVFGRDPSCDVVVKNGRCSRRHASLTEVPEGFRLVDMGSANGVFVLGRKIDDVVLREGDVFSIGDVFIRILPDDMPATLAMSRDGLDKTPSSPMAVPPSPPKAPPPPRETPREPPREAPRRPPPPPVARPEQRRSSDGQTGALLAPSVLGVCSILLGFTLMVCPFALRDQLGSLAYVIPLPGLAAGLAGAATLVRLPWSRGLHYVVSALWIVSCLFAPFGVMGMAYQVQGKDRRDTDTFFAIVLGLAGALAIISAIVATFLARIYIPTPLPL